jgi:hypothetical protein
MLVYNYHHVWLALLGHCGWGWLMGIIPWLCIRRLVPVMDCIFKHVNPIPNPLS